MTIGCSGLMAYKFVQYARAHIITGKGTVNALRWVAFLQDIVRLICSEFRELNWALPIRVS